MTQGSSTPAWLREIVLSPDAPIRRAVETLAEKHKRIVLIAGDDFKLQGVVTDADVRYAILRRTDFDAPVRDIMVTTPVTVSEGAPDFEILSVMQDSQCYEVPVVDSETRIVGVRFIDELLTATSQPTGTMAVVMAGGAGKRLRPLTENVPKPLIEVGERPILFTILDQLIRSGFAPIYLTVHYKGDSIREAVGKVAQFRSVVEFIEEKEPLGTAGALSLLPEIPDRDFLLVNSDLLTNLAPHKLMRFHEQEKNVMTVALKEHREQIPFGVAELVGSRIIDIEEKPIHTNYLNAGLYGLHPSVLERIPKGQAIDITDVIKSLLRDDLRVGGFPIHEYWIDIGKPEQLKQAERDFQLHFNANP